MRKHKTTPRSCCFNNILKVLSCCALSNLSYFRLICTNSFHFGIQLNKMAKVWLSTMATHLLMLLNYYFLPSIRHLVLFSIAKNTIQDLWFLWLVAKMHKYMIIQLQIHGKKQQVLLSSFTLIQLCSLLAIMVSLYKRMKTSMNFLVTLINVHGPWNLKNWLKVVTMVQLLCLYHQIFHADGYFFTETEDLSGDVFGHKRKLMASKKDFVSSLFYFS